MIWKLKKIQTLFSLSETKLSEDCIVPVKPNKVVPIRNQYFSDPERDFSLSTSGLLLFVKVGNSRSLKISAWASIS